MLLDPLIQEIADATGLNARTDRQVITRKMELALDTIDYLVDWNFAIEPFSVSIASGYNSAVLPFNVFRPLVCTYEDSSSNKGELNYMTLTEFKRETAKLGSTTTTTPENYSVGRDTLYVGPGLLGAAFTINGMIRRKLSFDDLDYLPSILVTSNTIMKIAKPGTPEYIMARSDWKDARELVKRLYKATSEKRSRKPLDRQIYHNWLYMRGLS